MALGRLGRVTPALPPILWVAGSLGVPAARPPGAATPAPGREGAPLDFAVRNQPLQSGQRLCTGLKSLLQAGQCMNRLSSRVS